GDGPVGDAPLPADCFAIPADALRALAAPRPSAMLALPFPARTSPLARATPASVAAVGGPGLGEPARRNPGTRRLPELQDRDLHHRRLDSPARRSRHTRAAVRAHLQSTALRQGLPGGVSRRAVRGRGLSGAH